MSNLVDTPPTDISRHDGFALFYYDVRQNEVNYLPGNAKFSVVYSPKEGHDWEVVYYQMFAAKNGMAVVSRRRLQPDEITYFERLLAASKQDTGPTPAIGNAGV